MHDVYTYYSDEAVRHRMTEFLGAPALEDATAVYIRGSVGLDDERETMLRPPQALWDCLVEGLDVARSFWDRESLLVDLDIEYVNFDYPGEAYVDPERAFAIQEPVEHAIQEILLSFGIAPLHLISGRGHHFLWRIGQDSRAFTRLTKLGPMPDFLDGFYAESTSPSGDHPPKPLTSAFSGLGLVMEYVAHRIKDQSARFCNVPVELTAVRVGSHGYGREMVSIDISEYGDPLTVRSLRIPFSIYSKTQSYAPLPGQPEIDTQQPIFLVPRHETDMREILLTMRNPDQTRRLARRASTAIPMQEFGTERLLDAYEQSRLAAFHRMFYAERHEPPDAWGETYDRAPLRHFPPCVRYILDHPNEWLLKPAGLEMVVRTFLALGWHPRHIAGLIRSRYERDFNWGDRWFRDNAGSRADFYTRVFAGLAATQIDELVDFNCRSTQEKDFCMAPDPTCNLEDYRHSLLERIRHERLASGPINGLFLPTQHL